MSDETESSNLAKYRTRNPVAQLLIARFFDRLRTIVEPLALESVLDAGCGEGEALVRLDGLLPTRVAGVDIEVQSVRLARERLPSAEIHHGSLYELDFRDDAFDLVLCLEVLEHLERPVDAVGELARVGEHVVVSVPHEPWFRLGALLRGRYWASLGNHPEHVNHWGSRTLRSLLEPELEVVELAAQFPWLIAHCVRPAPAQV